MTHVAQPSTSRRHLTYVDLAKGIAIVLVVWGHFVDQVLNANVYEELHALNLWLQTTIYSFHMPLFFALSGLLAGIPGGSFHRPGKYGDSLGKRSVRLLLPYLTVSLLQVPMRAVGRDHMPLGELPREMLVIFYDPSVQLWFIYALFIMFLIMPLIERTTGGRNWLTATVLVAARCSMRYIDFPYCEVDTILGSTIYFYVGLLLGRSYARGAGWQGVARYFWPSLGAFVVFANLRWCMAVDLVRSPYGVLSSVVGLGAGLTGTLVFLRVAQILSDYPRSWAFRRVRALGRYSYDIYLYHYMIMGTLNALCMRRGLPYAVLMAIMVLPSIAGPLLWGRFVVDRSKVLGLLCRGVRPRRRLERGDGGRSGDESEDRSP